MKSFYLSLMILFVAAAPAIAEDSSAPTSLAYCVPVTLDEPQLEIVIFRDPQRTFATLAFPRYSDIIHGIDLAKVAREGSFVTFQGEGFQLVIDTSNPASPHAGHYVSTLDLDASANVINPVKDQPLALRGFTMDCMTPNE